MPNWKINKFYGGISTGSRRGVEGSFYWGTGLDFKTDPDLLQSNLAMTKVSGANVTGLIKWFTHFDNSGSITYFGMDDAGKIYSDASNWTSLQTTPNSTGQGLCVFGNYLYYGRDANLGRYGDLTGAPTFTDAYKSLDSDTSWHPMKVFLNKLCVGHGRKIGTLDDSLTWTDAAITLPLGWKVKCLEVKGDFLYIGAWKGNSITSFEQGALFSWDGTSLTWNSVEFINESGVNALLNYNDTLYVWAGTRGNIYQYTGGRFYKIKRLPFIGAGKTAEVYPGAVTGYNGMVHFGGAGSTTSTTMYNGVYTWGQVEKNYPMVLNFDYPVSTGTTQAATLAIGAVYAASPVKLLVGWKDGVSYGVDLISTTTAQTNVVLETLIFDGGDLYRTKTAKVLKIRTAPFTGTEAITVKYKANRDTSWTTLAATGSKTTEPFEDASTKIFPFVDSNNGFFRWRELQIQITLTNGAKMIEAAVDFSFDGDQG